MEKNDLLGSKEFTDLVSFLKEEVKNSRLKATLAVNKELVMLYWRLGRRILQEQQRYNWGDFFLEKISQDLRSEFPAIKGLSYRNFMYMRLFASKIDDIEFTQQAAAQIPWGHNILLLDKNLPSITYIWYAVQTIENGWSRNVLLTKIESNLYERQVNTKKQISNFSKTLPKEQSDLAQNLLQDPYVFEFIDQCKNERDLEKSLIENIQKFILELGKGFAFVGSQYNLNVGGEDFFIDLLFYHLKLRCFVAIELKTGKFKPEYSGKMNFYLSALDKQVKHKDDNASIGIILCKEKNRIVAEYALDGLTVPMGISDYQLSENLPSEKELQQKFDSIEKDKEYIE